MNAGGPPGQLSRHSRLAERRRCRPVAELAGLVVGLALFSWLHNLAGTDVASATANAQALQSVERSLHLDIELAANHWLVEQPVLMQAAVLYYRCITCRWSVCCCGCYSGAQRCTPQSAAPCW